MSFNPTDSRTALKKRTFTITLSLGRLLTAIIALFFGAFWFFVIGLFVGRGSYPENMTPSLARLMPQQHVNSRILTVIADPPAQGPQAAEIPQLQTPSAAPSSLPVQAPQAAPPVPAPALSGELFDYSFQVASFKDDTSANAFVKKLQAAKLKAKVTKSQSTTTATVWHRVVVDFRGTPAEADALKVSFKSLNISDSLMLSKKAVAKP